MFLDEKLQRVLDDFSLLEDPQERLALLIERAKRIPPLPVAERNASNRVRGCVSIVWLIGEVRDGRCHFRSDAESPVVRGLVAFVCEFFNGGPVREVAASTIDPLSVLNLARHLSPTRRHGLDRTRDAIREFAGRATSDRSQTG